MSERNLRSRVPVENRGARPSHPSPSPHRRTPRRSSKRSRPIQILKRCNSEPSLWTAGGEHGSMTAPDDAALFRPGTCFNVLSSPDLLLKSPHRIEGYSKDAKVVVSVTVEGSTGAVRIMVKLGSSVGDTIKLVINKYCEEGRSPQLDKNAASTFELHHSYFSLESLSKSDVIGDIGSRSFYLRKTRTDHRNVSFGGEMAHPSSQPENVLGTPLVFLPPFISQKINKIIRRMRKLWKILGCVHCNSG